MDGFKSDYQQLFQLFQTRSIVPDAGDASTSNDPSIATSEIVRYDFNFEKFMQCFEQMNFTYIFCGRKTENEAREFTDNIYEYILDNLSMYLQIEIRIFSMYLLYALWSIQHKLFSFEVNIRVDHSIHRNIQNLVDNCLKQNQFDVIVIYRKLFLSGAFVYCQEVDPKGIYYRKYFKPKSDEAGNIQEIEDDFSETLSAATSVYFSALDCINSTQSDKVNYEDFQKLMNEFQKKCT